MAKWDITYQWAECTGFEPNGREIYTDYRETVTVEDTNQMRAWKRGRNLVRQKHPAAFGHNYIVVDNVRLDKPIRKKGK
jgi:hypothetical protein